jgi:hypothetical protein
MFPKYFLGQKFNPACGICDPGDTSDEDPDQTSFEPNLLNDFDQPFTRISFKNISRTF